ncbi:SAV_2336 N-terminal domain-related protein [Nostoc sp.]|uniref:SAV_2336 N-terminal domain-related protein n=1 Tax=Nostoc sp. TaxID=1180 RepID=UPI002FFB575D
MSKPSYYDAVKRFVNILEHSGLRKRLELSDEDIADTLWLALQMAVENTQIREKPPQAPKETETIFEKTDIRPPEPVEPSINIYTPPSDSSSTRSQNEENIEGLPFQAPAAPALTNKLQISRALRPLMRKVPSYSRRILDVEATVNQIVDSLIVEQESWVAITKPQPERWLNLELVVEENRSSFIWQETINELTQILENYGIFHTVRTWNLSSYHQGNLQLVSRKKGKQKNHCQYNYRELYHSNGRGLILLLSDCVSTIWQRETIYQWLQKWSNQSPTAIMQLFPERLWLSSELSFGYKVKLSAFNPGVPNSKLICREDLDIEQALNLPIITLEPESLKEWAKVVAGYGRIQTPAIVLDLDFVKEQVNKTVISQSSEASPEAIVDRFLATASPTAQRLAGLMAAVPVSLPVVHLIQKTMLPKSTPVNVAEVFLSGMIERKQDVSSSVSVHQEEVKNREVHEYDFVAEVRKLLNQAMRLVETEKVLDVVSEYIAEKMGSSIKSFTALLLNLPELSQQKQEDLLPFAHVAVEVLRNLGGKYAEFAEEIETNKLQKILDNNQPIFQLVAGEYTCAVKWGGQTGTWHEGTEILLISPQGKVKFRSRLGLAVIENLQTEQQKLSWSFENNRTAASITFKENSENSYFWSGHQTGKLFEGWLNYPNEGRIDFRGCLSNFEDQILRVSRETCPSGFTLVTYEEAIENRDILSRKLEAWDIARLAGGGSMDGSGYDSKIRQQDERGLGHSLCKRLNLGVIQFTIATLESQLDKAKGKQEEWIINRQQSQAESITEVLAEGIELELIEIPTGTFWMGVPEDELESRSNERPRHQVTVPSFYMGRYPITQAQWKAVAALPQVNRQLQPDPSNIKGANRSVEEVSWYDAVEFCDRLSQHTGKSYRLPSEAEWEYACRARTTTPFHFGETITSELANYHAIQTYGAGVKGIYRGETTEVGSFGVANAFGLYDMHGNVWEWCLDDWHDNYEGAPTDGSAWFYYNNNLSQKQGNVVLRGGSWDYIPKDCRSASRFNGDRDLRNDFIGFRIVCGVGRILQ